MKLAELQKKAASTETAARAQLEVQINALQHELKQAELKLAELEQASSEKWKSFQADVSAATARLRKAVDTATG